MKMISFASRVAFLCNLAFVAFVILSRIEAAKPAGVHYGVVTAVSYLSDIVITLGLSAIFLNFIMAIIYGVMWAAKKIHLTPRWLMIFNTVFLFSQIIYFFFR